MDRLHQWLNAPHVLEWWDRPDVRRGAGVDLFIGDVRSLHRGLGPWILRQFLKDIVFRYPSIAECFIDPSPRNHSAIRAFEKAGFRAVGAAADPDSGLQVHLMRITRRDFERGA